MNSTHLLFKTSLLCCAFFISISLQAGDIIASWTFNTGTQLPSVGKGTVSLIGQVSTEFGKTGINPGLALPGGLKEEDSHKAGLAFNTFNYPAQGTNAKTAGIQVVAGTVGYKNITISADVRQGGTSANKLMLQYTVDGVNWERAITYTTDENDTWYLRNFNFRSIKEVNNNDKFAIRFVTNFDDDVTDQKVYVPVKSSNIYSPTGSIRFDNIIIRGDQLAVTDDDRQTITGWNFDSKMLLPNAGSGELTIIGSVSYDETWDKSGIFPNSTIADQGVYDYAALKDGFGLQTIDYPAPGTSNKQAGLELKMNSGLYKDIKFSADIRHGGTAVNTLTLQYTINGSNWIDATSFKANSGDTWYLREFDFTNLSGANLNSQFAVRLVATMDGYQYVATRADRFYSTLGPIRYDNLTFSGRLATGLNESVVENAFYVSGRILYFREIIYGTMQLYTVSGIQVFNQDIQESVDLSALPSGIYIVSVNGIRQKIILK